MVLKRLVEVAEVEVEFKAVKFWRVEEALTRRLPVVVRPVTVAEFTVRSPLALIVRAETEEVAVPATVVVAR